MIVAIGGIIVLSLAVFLLGLELIRDRQGCGVATSGQDFERGLSGTPFKVFDRMRYAAVTAHRQLHPTCNRWNYVCWQLIRWSSPHAATGTTHDLAKTRICGYTSI